MNRLAHERSPYLLQHASNPVDWFPWGDEAFTKARIENKPIFLSIGYATCHWCHVMEHESFEHQAIAELLNQHFVSVKVDREERPDVDRVYMTFVQATTGSGGWPMSVFLTPELKPFYGGTYFPPASKWGRPGFGDLLTEIDRVWQVEPERLRASADEATGQLAAAGVEAPAAVVPAAPVLEQTTSQFLAAFDRQHAGFGPGPKFPRPSELLFLLREHARTGRPQPRDMALQTLRAMALGGLRDHVGGGFHRYAVDRAWRVPHFEKMLYDQAQLAIAYIEAAQVSGDPFFIEVAEDTLRYVMREMTDEHGGFYSAEDADSVPHAHMREAGVRKSEGAFYLWTAEEITRLFGPDGDVVRRHFGIEPGGNAPVDPHDEFAGANILYVARGLEALAEESGRPAEAVAAVLQRARTTMFEARLQRPRPLLDDKVLTAWNGLMIAAFARMARLMRGLGAPGPATAAPYLAAARHAASFVRAHLWQDGSRTLLRRYRAGHAEIDGYAEDYACTIFGLLELFAADPDPAWLSWAITLQERQDELFWDTAAGGWFSTTGRDPHILLRVKDTYDGAEPTASAIAAGNLLTLSQLVDRPEWRDRLERTLRLFAPQLETMGRAVPMMAGVLSVYHSRPAHVVIVGAGSGALERALAVRYLPHVTPVTLETSRQQAVASLLPLVAGMAIVDSTATAYVCRDFTCLPPLTAADDLLRALSPVQ